MNEQEEKAWSIVVDFSRRFHEGLSDDAILAADTELRELRAENARLRALLRRARSFVAVHPEHPDLVDEIDAALGMKEAT